MDLKKNTLFYNLLRMEIHKGDSHFLYIISGVP